MTNKELIRRFFRGRYRGDEESYGFFIKPLCKYKSCVNDFSLYSKTSQAPFATRASKNHFLITTPFVGANSENYNKHAKLVIDAAKELEIKYILSPSADKITFHAYMEEKINKNLYGLATDLRTGRYDTVAKYAETDKSVSENCYSVPEICYSVPENYQKLMENILILLNGEIKLGLPKNQVSLVDDDELQSVWCWLIKENPVKEDQELLRKTYTLSRLMASK